MSYTLSAQKDVHVDSKKDMHVDDSDLFLQIDKKRSELPLWIIFSYLYFVFSLQPYGHQLGRTGLLARLYVKFSCVFVSFHVVSWVRCGA